MRLTLAAVGRLKAGPERELFDRYWTRLESSGRKVGIAAIRLVELPESRAAEALERKADEAQRLLKGVGTDGVRIALDETGRALTSTEFSQMLGRHADQGQPAIAFMLGGPDGHGPAVVRTAHVVLNLGTLTLPHGLARVVLAEQLYRATTMLAGHPYHRA